MRRQICFRDSEVRDAGAIIHGGVITLNALGNGDPELLPVVTRRDPLSFRRIADESSLEQDRRDFDVSQNMKARVAHSAIEDRNARQNRGMNGSSQRDVLPIQRIAGVPFQVGARGVMFARSIRRHAFRRERVTFHAGAAGGRVEMDAHKDGVRKTVGEIYALFQGNTNVR